MRFSGDLYKQGQQNAIKQYSNCHREDNRTENNFREQNQFIQPKFETPGFDAAPSFFDKSDINQDRRKQKNGRRFMNKFCFKIFVVNLTLVLFSFLIANLNKGEIVVQETFNYKNLSQGYELNYTNGESSENVDLIFEKLNQDLKAMIEDSNNQSSKVLLKDYFSLSYISLVLQIFIWVVFSLYPTQKE